MEICEMTPLRRHMVQTNNFFGLSMVELGIPQEIVFRGEV